MAKLNQKRIIGIEIMFLLRKNTVLPLKYPYILPEFYNQTSLKVIFYVNKIKSTFFFLLISCNLNIKSKTCLKQLK